MYSNEQVKIAETFLGTAVNSGVLAEEVCHEMIKRIKNQDEVLMTYKEVEAKLKVSRSTVERMLKKKELIGGKHNGLVRITKSSVDAIIRKIASVE